MAASADFDEVPILVALGWPSADGLADDAPIGAVADVPDAAWDVVVDPAGAVACCAHEARRRQTAAAATRGPKVLGV